MIFTVFPLRAPSRTIQRSNSDLNFFILLSPYKLASRRTSRFLGSAAAGRCISSAGGLIDRQTCDGALFQQHAIHTLADQIADHPLTGIDLGQAFDTAMPAVTDQVLAEVAEQDCQLSALRPGHGGAGDDGPSEQAVRRLAGEILNPDIPAACGAKLAKHRHGRIVHQIHAVIAVLLGNAAALGYEDSEVNAFFYKALRAVGEDYDTEALLPLVLEVGTVNLRCMELLDRANTERFGHPQPTQVGMTVEKGSFIVITGHDLNDLKQLLEQTEGRAVNVYTHGEMLPAHAYPELK